MAALNNITTTDDFTEAATLHAPGSTRLVLRVRNAAVVYELGQGYGGIEWTGEVFAPPGDGSIGRRFDHVRVRSAKVGTPAQVTVEAVSAAEAT